MLSALMKRALNGRTKIDMVTQLYYIVPPPHDAPPGRARCNIKRVALSARELSKFTHANVKKNQQAL